MEKKKKKSRLMALICHCHRSQPNHGAFFNGRISVIFFSKYRHKYSDKNKENIQTNKKPPQHHGPNLGSDPQQE